MYSYLNGMCGHLGSINTETLQCIDCTHVSCHRHQCGHMDEGTNG